MLKSVLFTLFILSSFFANAQTFTVKGILLDESDKKPVAGATVRLAAQNDSTVNFNLITDAKGGFTFNGMEARIYLLYISSIGYDSLRQSVIVKDTSIDLGKIDMYKGARTLEGVTVTGTVPPVVQKGDTSQFSASAYKVNPDATTEDLIKKMPGITVARDGTVTAQGETVRKVTIDGRDFFGDDASAALKNLPSEIVDKIQVFDRLSDQAQLTGFDDGNSVKAINVVTKSGIKNGQFGRAYAGYGTDKRYNAGGNVSFFKEDRRLSIVANFNNINQQNFGSQDLLGVTSGGGGGGGFGGGGGGGRGGGGGGRGPGGGGSDNFTVGQANAISKTNAIGLNYSDKWGSKINVSGSYFFNNSTNNNLSVVNRETQGSVKQFSTQRSNSTTENNNHRFNARFEYKIDSSNSLFIIPNVSFQRNNSSSLSSLLTRNSSNADSLNVNNSNANSSSDRNGYNIRNNIMFRHAFAKKGRSLSLGFNTNFTKNDANSFINAQYRFYDSLGGFRYDSLQNQFYDNTTNGNTISGNVSYTEPIGKKGQLQVDYTPSVQKNHADQQTFNYDGAKYTDFDSSLSNKFDNTITTHNAGLNYRLAKNRDDMLSIGVNVQTSRLESERIFPTTSSVNQTFSNILPNAMWRKKISTTGNIRVFYRASTNFPTVNQLQDVVNNTNPLNVSVGNPDLKQSYTHFLAGRYSYTNSQTSRSFFANLLLQTASDYITNITYIVAADSLIQQNTKLARGSQLSKPINLDGYRNMRSFFTYSTPIKALKTVVNLNAGFGYSRLPGQLNNISTITNNFTYNGGVVFASNISEYVDFNLSYNANFNDAKTTGGQTSVNNYVNQAIGANINLLSKSGWFIQNDLSTQIYSGLSGGLDQHFTLWNAAIGKKFLKSRAAEIKLSVFDLLKQNQSITRTVSNNYIEDSQSTVLRQYFMLTFTYNLKNFGKKKAGADSRMQSDGPGFNGPPTGGYPGRPGGF